MKMICSRLFFFANQTSTIQNIAKLNNNTTQCMIQDQAGHRNKVMGYYRARQTRN